MLLFSDKQRFFHKNKKKENEKMWTKMNVSLLEIFRSETAFICLGSNIQNNFIVVCVSARYVFLLLFLNSAVLSSSNSLLVIYFT